MKLNFITLDPVSLYNEIIILIESGDLQTWEIYVEGGTKYLKHIGQWGERGVIELTYQKLNRKLSVEVFKFKSVNEDVSDFEGYYLGRFCELIFVNFPNRFSSIERD